MHAFFHCAWKHSMMKHLEVSADPLCFLTLWDQQVQHVLTPYDSCHMGICLTSYSNLCPCPLHNPQQGPMLWTVPYSVTRCQRPHTHTCVYVHAHAKVSKAAHAYLCVCTRTHVRVKDQHSPLSIAYGSATESISRLK